METEIPMSDRDTTHVMLPLDEHPKLDVSADFAHLTIVPINPGERPWAEVRSKRTNRVRVRAEDGTTYVRIGGEDWGFAMWNGKDRVTLHVPPDVHARVVSAAGRLFVERLDGCDLVVENDAGTIDLDDVGGALRIVTDAGRIDGSKVRGTLDVTSQAGAVRLDVLGLEPGEHHVRAEVGAVKLDLARGMDVRIEAHAAMGTSKVDYPQRKDAAAVLHVETEVGAIKVRASDRSVVVPRWDRSGTGPYRASADAIAPVEAAEPAEHPAFGEELDRILAKVADGSLSPSAAAELLRALRR